MNLKKLTDIPFIFSTLHSNAQYRERERESNYRIHLENLSCKSAFFLNKNLSYSNAAKDKIQVSIIKAISNEIRTFSLSRKQVFYQAAITEKKLIRDQKYRN